VGAAGREDARCIKSAISLRRVAGDKENTTSHADVVGEFLTFGGNAAYVFGYEPSSPINEWNACAGYGQMILLEADDEGHAKWPMPTYFAMQLLNSWAKPGDQPHKLFPTRPHDCRSSRTIACQLLCRPKLRGNVVKGPQSRAFYSRCSNGWKENFVGGVVDPTVLSQSIRVEICGRARAPCSLVPAAKDALPIRPAVRLCVRAPRRGEICFGLSRAMDSSNLRSALSGSILTVRSSRANGSRQKPH
jgi:hypothetical protein